MKSQGRLSGCMCALAVSSAVLFLCAAAQDAPKTGKPEKRAAPVQGTVLQVAGEVSHHLSLTSAEFAQLPRQAVRAKAHDGVASEYTGVALAEILAQAGVPAGRDLRGKAMTLYLVVEASDGYRAIFALPELDPAFTDRVILLADRRDGRPLSSHDGPLQIIVPGEKRQARWVRQVIKLTVGRA